MGEAAASTMGIRRTEKAAPPPTGRRQRSSSSPTPAAWPAFPIESSNNAAVGLGLGRSSPAGSPSLSSTSEVSVGAKSGASRSNSAGPRSPLMIRKKSYCCNSCRPTPASDRHQRQQAGKNGGDIAYDDVFGGPPKYLQNDRKMSIPGYDEVCWSSKSSSPRLSKTKSRPAELPVFDPPAYNTEVFRGSPADRPKSPTPAAEIAYDDVFGGPVSGPRPRILKDLLKCSTSESKSPLSESSYRSPASVHSTSKESTHANPIYEFETEAVQISKCGGRNVSGKSSQTYVECEIFRYGYKKPIGSSVSSSPFTEHYDDSAMNSYSTKISKSGATLGDYEEVCRKPPRPHSSKLDCETTSSNQTTSSDSELSEIEYTRRRFSKGAGRRSKGRQSFNYVRRGSRARSEIDKGSPFRSFQGDSPEAEFFIKSENGTPHKKNDKVYGSKADKNLPPEQDLNFKDSSHSSTLDSVTAIGQEVTARQEVSFVTVDRVKLKTEPTNGRPPRRPAPSPQNSIGNTFEADSEEENEISELLESEAFMEYSIKDLDGLVAEEYSVSESSPSASNSTKTRSCPSHDDDDSNMDVEPPESVFSRERSSARQTEAERESELKQKDKRIRSSWTAGNTVENSGSNAHVSPKVDNLNAAEAHITSAFEKMMKYSPAETSKSNLQEPASSSSSSPGEKLQAPDWSTVSGETPERRKSRLERQQRDVRRVAKALDEKKRRELEIEQQQAEKHRVGEILEDVVKRWAAGKQGNLRALVSTLQYILWPDCGWQPVSLSDIIEPVAVRKSYRKATLFVHPDKVQQKGATVEQKYIAEKVFDLLQEAWAVFNYEQLF